jgi:hypothetical protein
MNLEQTSMTLQEQFGSVEGVPSKAVDRFFENLGKFAFGGFGAVVAIGIGFLLYTIFVQMLLEGTRIAFGVFLMLFIVFASLSLVYVIYNESRKDNKAKRAGSSPEPAAPAELAARDTGRFLNESTHMPVPSVLEDTTDLLKVDAKTRRL